MEERGNVQKHRLGEVGVRVTPFKGKDIKRIDAFQEKECEMKVQGLQGTSLTPAAC